MSASQKQKDETRERMMRKGRIGGKNSKVGRRGWGEEKRANPEITALTTPQVSHG